MKKFGRNYKKGLSLLLVAALVVSSLFLGLGQLQTQAAQASDQLGTFRVSARTNAQNCSGTGTDADFEIVFTYDDAGTWYSGNIVPDGDMEESQTNTWIVSNVPVRPITSIGFRMMNYANNDDWYWDWAKIEYCYDGTNYAEVGYNNGDGTANGTGYTINFNYNGAIDTTYMRTLTWSGNGGTVNGGSTYVVYAVQGATYPNNANNVPASLARTGYTFTGWSPAIPTVCPQSDTTYNAQWSINSYSIYFNGNGGSTPATITQNYGTAVSVPSSSRTGYTFAGWSPACPTTMPANNTTCVAQWNINSYYVYFDEQGGTAVSDIYQQYGSAITAPANPTKTGYTFAGWSPAVPSTMPAGNTTCVAQWNVNSYYLTFNANGGTGGTGPTLTPYGTSISAPAVSWTGHTFTGWSPSVPATMPAADSTYTAQWSLDSYTITWAANGGTGGGQNSCSYGVMPTPISAGTRTGYTFTGWSPTIVAATGPATYTAQWSLNSYTITWAPGTNGTGGGQNSCNHGATPTPMAVTPNTGYHFVAWSPSIVAATGNTTYTATWAINSYTITWAANGGTGGGTNSCDHGAMPTPISAGTRTGYTFTGWSPTIVAATGPATYTAQWSLNSYTITWAANGGTGGGTNSCDHGAMPTPISAGTKTGYTFTGWSPTIVTATGPATYTAQWSLNSYTITWAANGGTGGGTNSCDHFAMPTPISAGTKTGSTFTGWSPTIVTATGPATYTAQWSENTYDIIFNGNTSTGGTMSNQGIVYGQSANLTANAFSKTGYSFAGWNTAANGGGTPYANQASFGPMGDSNVTLYAQWSTISYNVAFNGNGNTGGSTTTPQAFTYGTAQNLNANGFTKTGYTFLGWAVEDPNATSEDFADQASVQDLSTTQGATVTLYAVWSIASYTIYFDEQGGSTVADITQNYGTSVTAPADPTKAGYTFNGWSPAVPSTMPAGGETCVAQWTKNQSTITFDSAGGSAVAAITQDEGTTVTAPANPTKAGYTFTGWDPVVPATMPVDDVTCVAQWTKNQSTITFDSAGGSAVSPITQDEGTAVTAPANPTKAGYTFTGWDPVVPATMPVDDVTCVAQWTANQSTITFDSAGGSAVSPITQDEGTAVTAPADPTRDGYIFAGWLPVVPSTMPVDDVTCVAQWTPDAPPTSTITFDLNGGTSAAIDPITQDEGTTVTAPADPTREGYTFVGWDPVVPTLMPVDDVLCVAQWLMDPVLVPAEASTTVIDNTDYFIYGLTEGMSQADFESMFVEVLGNGRLEITPVFEGIIGTGTKVELINNSNEEVIATYYVVIFGDVTGDGLIDAVDADSITNYQNFALEWDFEASPYLFVASDLSGDTLVDAFDADIITNYQNFVIGINQATGEVTSL